MHAKKGVVMNKEILNVNKMTKKQFMCLRLKDWSEDIGMFTSLVILPTSRIHDSGYRCMDFVAIKGDEPICRLSGCSDVIHIDGIGGLGKDWIEEDKGMPKFVVPTGWSVDCLKASGLLRILSPICW